jgi:hypothetical protein
MAGSAPWVLSGAGGAREIIELKRQACSRGQIECPDPGSYNTHQVIELSEIPMPVSPLFLGTLLPFSRMEGSSWMPGRLGSATPMVSMADHDDS